MESGSLAQQYAWEEEEEEEDENSTEEEAEEVNEGAEP